MSDPRLNPAAHRGKSVDEILSTRAKDVQDRDSISFVPSGTARGHVLSKSLLSQQNKSLNIKLFTLAVVDGADCMMKIQAPLPRKFSITKD